MNLPRIFLFALCTASVLPAAVVFNDTFEDGNRTTVGGGLNWYSSLGPGSLTVSADSFAGGGSTSALAFSSTDTFRRFAALFPATPLGPSVGDTVTLSFAMRFTQAPASNQWGFRFGLFGSNGTSITSDNPNGNNQPSQENDDIGYHVKFSTGTGTTLNEIYREPAGNNPLGGASPYGGDLLASAGSPSIINDQLLHTFVWQLTRTTETYDGDVSWSLVYDGNTKIASATDSGVGYYDLFDTVYFGQGNINSNFTIDNVLLEHFTQEYGIPEPNTLAMLLLGVGLMYRRRFFRSSEAA